MPKSRDYKQEQYPDLMGFTKNLQKLYKVSAIDVYMQLAYYSGLSAGLCGLGLYERVHTAHTNAAKLFQWHMQRQRHDKELHHVSRVEGLMAYCDKDFSWHATDVTSQNPFPYLPRNKSLNDGYLEDFACLIDVVDKTRDALVHMCAELARLILTGKRQEALDFMQQYDEKIVLMFETLQDEIHCRNDNSLP